MKLKVKIILVIVIVLVTSVIGGSLLFGNNSDELASIEEKIQNYINQISILTSQSLYQFQNIQDKQTEGEMREALDLVIEEKERMKEINNISMILTEELKELAKISISFSDKIKRQKIEEAIQFQIEAIGHLLNYGSGVEVILEDLAKRYEAELEGREFDVKRDINQLIELIKKEIELSRRNSESFVLKLGEVE